jgi:nitrite reductase/ring-hydroxylating ferredoxin subunit
VSGGGRTRVHTTPAGVELYALGELADQGARNFVLQIDDAFFRGFVVRAGGLGRGNVDRCPHQGLPLARVLVRYLTPDGARIACSWHGALFRVDGGACLGGRWAGGGPAHGPVTVEAGVGTTACVPATAEAAVVKAGRASAPRGASVARADAR